MSNYINFDKNQIYYDGAEKVFYVLNVLGEKIILGNHFNYNTNEFEDSIFFETDIIESEYPKIVKKINLICRQRRTGKTYYHSK